MGGQVGMINLSDMMGKAFGQQPKKRRKLRVADAWDKLIEEESDKRLDNEDVNRTALKDAEANGIVFLDEIDKRSEEHTYELQSLMRISYAVFCLKKKNKKHHTN